MMQRPPGDGLVNSATPPAMRSLTPHSTASVGGGLSRAASLPDRNVTAATIEDAYLSFVLYCNPAVPVEVDSTALREAFRTPPKSGGKSFSTFALFELIKKLETKEIKTWAELALKLGVEPPDQEKGQSSQKIQQYAVRLKRWMHSMHVDAFFEYLLSNPHPYWTQIPTDPNLSGDTLRDGVAAEDDMALRALLPQIRPKRGRRRPDEDDSGRPSPQRPRLDSPMSTSFSTPRGDPASSTWSAQPDGRLNGWLPPPTSDSRLGSDLAMPQQSGPSWPGDSSQTPMTAYPHSAITPSTRNAFWGDEPRSAVTPSKGKPGARRHGAKVVSSAWRSGGSGGTGKTRGRPPINRTADEGPYSAYPISETPAFALPSPNYAHFLSNTAVASEPGSVAALPPPGQPQATVQPESTPDSAGPRNSKPSRLSLQVPERVGGEVRLATPPPSVMVNGQAPTTTTSTKRTNDTRPRQRRSSFDLASVDILNGRSPGAHNHNAFDHPPPPTTRPVFHAYVRLEDPNDRTNMAELEAFFVHTILSAEWMDTHGEKVHPRGVDEAQALASTVIEDLLRSATTKETFLINLAALAGSKILMTTTSLRIIVLEQCEDHNKYICNWELRFGDIHGEFSMKEQVSHHKWKTKAEESRLSAAAAAAAGANGGSNGAGAGGGGVGSSRASSASIGHGGGGGAAEPETDSQRWQRKYEEMLELVKQKDEVLSRMKTHIMEGLMVRPGDGGESSFSIGASYGQRR